MSVQSAKGSSRYDKVADADYWKERDGMRTVQMRSSITLTGVVFRFVSPFYFIKLLMFS
jgi:hypothetical protein